MPGDLKDPEQFAPYHYDERFTEDPSIFDQQASNLNVYLQSIADEYLGRRLNSGELKTLISILDERGFLHRNPGEEGFKEEVKKQLKNRVMAKKVVSRCLKI